MYEFRSVTFSNFAIAGCKPNEITYLRTFLLCDMTAFSCAQLAVFELSPLRFQVVKLHIQIHYIIHRYVLHNNVSA